MNLDKKKHLIPLIPNKENRIKKNKEDQNGTANLENPLN